MDEQESLEVTAKSVRDAIDKAVQMLGRPRDDLEITVLSEGSRGILGIGGEEARILVAVRAPEPAAVAATTPTAEDGAVGGETDPVAVGQRVVESLLTGMRVFADVEIEERDGERVLNIVGDDVGILIGRRGNTLSALQFVTNLIVAKRVRKWSRVTIDVEDYRVRREATLSNLAQRMAERVQQTGQPAMLEAMPANERRIIHLTLAHHPYVTTSSIGEGEQRQVVISPRR